MFTKAGDFKVKITETCLAEPKFETAGPNGFDVCLHVQAVDDPGQADWWRGEPVRLSGGKTVGPAMCGEQRWMRT